MKTYATPMFFFLFCLMTAGLPLYAGTSTGTPGTELARPVGEGVVAPRSEAGLITFTAAPAASVNQVQWTMIGNERTATVTVERTQRGTGEWLALAVFRPEANREELAAYEYIDVAPLDEASYRLRFTFTDGSSVASEEVEVIRVADLFAPRLPARYVVGGVSPR